MTEKEWMKEGLDLKLTALLYCRKIWISVVCALAGAAFGGGFYFLVHVVYAPAREYEAVSKLYLTFAADDDGDAYQYYNGYTWNDLMGTEPILDKIMEELDGKYDREDVKAAVTADILSDIRVLTVTVNTNAPEETDSIIRASEAALIRFGQEMKEFDGIEVIDHGQAVLVVVADETIRAVLAGAAAGFLLSLLGLAFACIMDGSVYVPSDFEKRYGCPVLGVTFKGNAEAGKAELERHMALVRAGRAEVMEADTGSALIQLPEKQTEGAALILKVPYGKGNGKLLERWVAEAKLYGYEILGAVITEADLQLYRCYFAPFGRKKRAEG